MGYHGATTRRGFLKACGTAAITIVGVSALPASIRKAWAGPPVWAAIPDQIWNVGVPVYLNLADYCTDPDGDPLYFYLEQALPSGLALNGSVVSGTPSSLFSATQIVAFADDRAPITDVPTEGQPPQVRPHIVAVPNPSSGAVRFVGARGTTVESSGTLLVFSVTGRLVYKREVRVAGGHYEIGWDGRTTAGAKLPTGVYMATVATGSETVRTRLVVAQ